ncbi:MAG: extracellular solute-binding protein [Firmicutes bacterium]|nr:extracellular solute-binding protein [Bacillota bacterium]
MMKRFILLLSIFAMLFAQASFTFASTKIEIVTCPGSMVEYLSQLIEKYQAKHPDVKFTLTVMEQEQQRATLPVIMSTPGAPPTGWLNYGSGDVPALVETGAVENLDRYYKKYGWWSFLPKHLNTHRINGSMYHFSLAFVTTPLIFYNKAIFAKVGIETPKTLEDLFTISAKLRKAGYQPLLMGDRDAWPGFHMYQVIASRTTPLEEYNKILYMTRNEVKMGDYPGFAEAFQIMRDMETKGVWGDGVLSMDDMEARQVFLNRKGAMYESGTWIISELRKGLGDELGFFLFPQVHNNIPIVLTVSYPDEYILSAYVDQRTKDIIADFYNYVLSTEGQKIVATTGAMPIRTDLTSKSFKGSKVDPIAIEIMELFGSGKYDTTDEIVTFWGNELYAELRSVVQKVIGGQVSPKEAVVQLDKVAARVRGAKK